MRKQVGYSIYKNFPKKPQCWDGPFPTEKEAQDSFDLHYRNDRREQDFVIVKVTEEPLPFRRRRSRT